MPMSAGSDIVHIAVTDHRILRVPESQAAVNPPAGASGGSPLALLNGDELGSSEIESLGRELGIALTLEGELLPNSSQRKQVGNLALGYLERALAEHPDDLVALRMKARAFAITGRLRDAIALDDRVLASAPDYEQVLWERVQHAIELGETRTALAPAARAVFVNPWSSAAYERLAYIQLQSGDWSAGAQAARESLRLDPFGRFARMFLIQSLHHQGDMKLVEAEFRTLLDLFPNEREFLERWFAQQSRSRGG
jgi:tetratricopeptide (TPR) repeat protein